MSETIITKTCCYCKQVKLLSEFYTDYKSKDGYQYQCKACKKQYQQSKKGRECSKRYRQSEKGKKNHRCCIRRYQKHFPERKKAKDAVDWAIRTGKIPRANTLKCSCGNQAKQYHHHKGYAKEHWLDVIAVCVSCHHNMPRSYVATSLGNL
ncbi:MAG: hypothetical protein V3U75_04290 [Methylococcaceae bacterium]